MASSAVHTVTVGFISPCHSLGFSIVFLVLQHVTGPATLVNTSGVCSPSLCVLRIPNCEYSEYPTAGALAPPPPTVQAENDIRKPPHNAGASTHSIHFEYV